MKARGMGCATRGGNFRGLAKPKNEKTGPVMMAKGGCAVKKYRKGGMAKKGCKK